MSFHLPVKSSVLLKASVLDQNSIQLVQAPNEVGATGGAAYVQWSSSNTSIATVSNGPGMNRGLVTGVGAGTATITATYTDTLGNTATGTVSAIVYVPQANSIQIIAPSQ